MLWAQSQCLRALYCSKSPKGKLMVFRLISCFYEICLGLFQVWAYFRINTMITYISIFRRIRKYEYNGIFHIFSISTTLAGPDLSYSWVVKVFHWKTLVDKNTILLANLYSVHHLNTSPLFRRLVPWYHEWYHLNNEQIKVFYSDVHAVQISAF